MNTYEKNRNILAITYVLVYINKYVKVKNKEGWTRPALLLSKPGSN